MKTCIVDSCNGKHKAHGYCDRHYQRLKKHGDVDVYFKPKKCLAEGCEDKYYGKGYCNKHYLRLKHHGDLTHKRSPKYKTPEEAYNAQVVKKGLNECWGWSGKFHDYGYGTLRYNSKKWTAHRFSYIYHIGNIPSGMFVCHHCDNPKCTNPNHLFLGTNLDNINDCIKKGRHPFSANNREKRIEEARNAKVQDND